MTQTLSDSLAAAVKLPVWRTAIESYRVLAAHPRDLARIGWLPLFALFLLNLVVGTFDPVPDMADPETAIASAGPMIGKALAKLVIQSAIAAMTLVVWHRVVMLGHGTAGRLVPLRAGPRELRYLGSWMLIGIVSTILMVIVGLAIILAALLAMAVAEDVMMFASGGTGLALGGRGEMLTLAERLGMPLAIIVALYFTVRLSLVLPATATGKDAGFRRAWSASTGNGARMVAALLVVTAPFQLALTGLAEATRAAAGSWPFYPLAFLASLGFLLFILATGTVLSLFSLGLDDAPAQDRTQDATGVTA